VDPPTATIEYACAEHRGPDVLAPQEVLDGSDVAAVLQWMGCKRMTVGWSGAWRAQPHGRPDGPPFESLIHAGGDDAGPSVEVVGRSGKYPLPAPLAVGIRVLGPSGAWPLGR